MSVTIAIVGNHDYCETNGLSRKFNEDCACFYEGVADPNCPFCAGKGAVQMTEYPFELNICSDNFKTLWNSLALPFDWCGSIDSRLVLSALRCFDEALVERSTEQSGGNGKCLWFDAGISPERAKRYIDSLTVIANEANRREELICWNG